MSLKALPDRRGRMSLVIWTVDEPDEDEIGSPEDWGRRSDQDDRAMRMKFKD